MENAFRFLPAWPFHIDSMVIFGLIVVAGLIGGELAHRCKILPRITGYMAIGLILGPSCLNLLTLDYLNQAKVFVDIALGLVVFQLGLSLDLTELRQDRRLLCTGAAESMTSFVVIYYAFIGLQVAPLYALMAAAIGISSSPAVLLLVVRELGAEGPVTQRAINLVAMNNVLSAIAFMAFLPLLHLTEHAPMGTVLLQPLYLFAGSILLGYLLTRLVLLLARFLGRSESVQFPLLVAMIVLATALSKDFNLSIALVLLMLGVFTRNLDRRDDMVEVKFGRAGDIFFLLLFVVSGANLHLQDLLEVGGAALVFVLARCGAKLLVVVLGGGLSGFGFRRSTLTGLTLVPMAGMAIGLTQTATRLYPQFGDHLATIILASVAVFETVGPIITEYALKAAGEVAADQAVDH